MSRKSYKKLYEDAMQKLHDTQREWYEFRCNQVPLGCGDRYFLYGKQVMKVRTATHNGQLYVGLEEEFLDCSLPLCQISIPQRNVYATDYKKPRRKK